MTEEQRTHQGSISRQIATLLNSPWMDAIGRAWKVLQGAIQCRSFRGMYEVLEHETTLELKDRTGKRATFEKEKRVRYLQDNIIAYHDQAWGDGEILLGYRSTQGLVPKTKLEVTQVSSHKSQNVTACDHPRRTEGTSGHSTRASSIHNTESERCH